MSARASTRLEAFRFSAGRDSASVCYGEENKAGVPALFAAVLTAYESQYHIARGTLQQLSRELNLLSDVFVAKTVEYSDDDMAAMLKGMAERARVAVEVVDRIEQANRQIPAEGSAEQ